MEAFIDFVSGIAGNDLVIIFREKKSIGINMINNFSWFSLLSLKSFTYKILYDKLSWNLFVYLIT